MPASDNKLAEGKAARLEAIAAQPYVSAVDVASQLLVISCNDRCWQP